jgi:hypothetical protein
LHCGFAVSIFRSEGKLSKHISLKMIGEIWSCTNDSYVFSIVRDKNVRVSVLHQLDSDWFCLLFRPQEKSWASYKFDNGCTASHFCPGCKTRMDWGKCSGFEIACVFISISRMRSQFIFWSILQPDKRTEQKIQTSNRKRLFYDQTFHSCRRTGCTFVFGSPFPIKKSLAELNINMHTNISQHVKEHLASGAHPDKSQNQVGLVGHLNETRFTLRVSYWLGSLAGSGKEWEMIMSACEIKLLFEERF